MEETVSAEGVGTEGDAGGKARGGALSGRESKEQKVRGGALCVLLAPLFLRPFQRTKDGGAEGHPSPPAPLGHQGVLLRVSPFGRAETDGCSPGVVGLVLAWLLCSRGTKGWTASRSLFTGEGVA